MKKTVIILIIILLIAAPSVNAQSYKMALGIRFSTADAIVNNSISFKYFFNETMATEALLSFGDPLAIGILIQKHKPLFAQNFTYFYGGGAYVGFSSPKHFGVQGVAGLDYKFTKLPLNLSIDWKPELNILEYLSLEPAVLGISARFTF